MNIEIPKTGDPQTDWWLTTIFGGLALLGTLIYLFSKVFTRIDLVMEKLKLVSKDAKDAKHQVQNDHGTNLRDDLDRVLASIHGLHEKHTQNCAENQHALAEIRDRVDAIQVEQAHQGEKQKDMGATLTRALDGIDSHSRDIGGIRQELRHERGRVDDILMKGG